MAIKRLITVGADPELFLRDRKTGEMVSAHGLIPGTKLEPHPVEGGAIQVDGAAAEFNITPATKPSQFITNINQVMTTLQGHVPGYDLVIDPVCVFKETYFNSLPDEVKELGCNPDFNAYTGKINNSPDGTSTTMRTASGHIHIGWTKDINPTDPNHFTNCIEVVKQLDYYLGMPSLMWDHDSKRRKLYGMAGCFRPKPYGVEYRTMSNVWLRSVSVQEWVFSAAVKAVEDLINLPESMFEKFGNFAKKTIDGNDIKWYNKSDGQNIFATMRMNWPHYKECIDYGKPKKEKPSLKGKENWTITVNG